MDSLNSISKLQSSTSKGDETKDTVSHNASRSTLHESAKRGEEHTQVPCDNLKCKFADSRLFDILSKLSERVVKNKTLQKSNFVESFTPQNLEEEQAEHPCTHNLDILDPRNIHLDECFDHEEVIGYSETVTSDENNSICQLEANPSDVHLSLNNALETEFDPTIQDTTYDSNTKTKADATQTGTTSDINNPNKPKVGESHSFRLHMAFVRNLIKKSLNETNPDGPFSGTSNNFPLSANILQTDMLKTLKLAEYRPVSPVEQVKKKKNKDTPAKAHTPEKHKETSGIRASKERNNNSSKSSSKLKISLKDLFLSAAGKKSQSDMNNNNNDKAKDKASSNLVSLLRCGICSTPKKKGRPRKCEHICMAENIMSNQKSSTESRDGKHENRPEKTSDPVVVVHPQRKSATLEKDKILSHCSSQETDFDEPLLQDSKTGNGTFDQFRTAELNLSRARTGYDQSDLHTGSEIVTENTQLNSTGTLHNDSLTGLRHGFNGCLRESGDHLYQSMPTNTDYNTYQDHYTEAARGEEYQGQWKEAGDIEVQGQLSEQEFNRQLNEARNLLVEQWLEHQQTEIPKLKSCERENGLEHGFNDEALDMVSDEERYVWQLIEEISPKTKNSEN